MTRMRRLLTNPRLLINLVAAWLLVSGCQTVRGQDESWPTFIHEVARMQPEQMLTARAEAEQAYLAEPSDVNRLKAGYALSRTPASIEHLARGRYILAEISDASALAPMRDLLIGEIDKYMELQGLELRARRLQLETEALQARRSELEEELAAQKQQIEAQQEQLDMQEKQLATLKKIEGDLVESQEETDEMDPDP